MSNSKKSSLTYEASLGACLSFAGQVLSSSLPSSQVCTKDVLSPIVVEAHRFGQQVSKSCGFVADRGVSSSAVDPRKLLRKLQTYQSEPEWDRPGVQIDRLAFEDLTWDSQGDVTQTLEMELLELEMRAVETNTSVCVLVALRRTADEPKSTPETAILWLPLDNHHQGSNNGKKQYLLYVCPGRIKVVKSVIELFRKMRDEIKLMSDSDAVYNVWTLLSASAAQVKKKVVASNQPRAEVEPQDQTPRNAEPTPEKARVVAAITKQKHEEASKRQLPEEEQVPEPYHMKYIRPELNEARVLPTSIFSFATEPSMRKPSEQVAVVAEPTMAARSQEHQVLNSKAASSTRERLEWSPNEAMQSSEIAKPSRRQVVSSSYSNGIPAKAKVDSEQEMTRAEKNVMVWQSLDSNLKKPMLLPNLIEKTPSHDEDNNSGEELASTTKKNAAECSNASRSSPDGDVNDPASASLELPQRMIHPVKYEKTASIFTFLEEPTTSRRSSALPSNDAPLASISCESSSALVSEGSKKDHSVDHQDKRASSGFTSADAADEALGIVAASQESEDIVSGVGNAGDAHTYRQKPVPAQDIASGAGEAHMDDQKPVPARKNYRSKLGNRVWWELQCVAETLLQQQQQTLEPTKREHGSEPHYMSKNKCSPSKTQAERNVTTAQSPLDKERAFHQYHADQRARNHSEDNASNCEVRCSPHPASPKSTPAATITSSFAPTSVLEHQQVLLSPQGEANSVQVTHAVSGSTKRVFLPDRVAEPEGSRVGHAEFASHSIAMKEAECSRPATVSTCRSSISRRSVPPGGVDQTHTPLFIKTTLFQQDHHEPVSNRKPQSTANGTPVQHAHLDAPSQDVDTTVSKSGARLRSAAAHCASSKASVSCPHEYDYDVDDQAHTPSAAMHTPNAHTSHVKHSHSGPKWYADAQDSKTLHGDEGSDDDDDDLVQNQWANTRTSYAVEREARQAIASNDKKQQQRSQHFPLSAPSSHRQEPEANVAPFNVRGRVPIRSNREVPLSRQTPPKFGSSSDEEDDAKCVGPVKLEKQNQAALRVGAISAADYLPARTKEEKDDDEEEEEDVAEEDVFRPRNAETTKFQPMADTSAAIDRHGPHVATFITIDVDSSKSSSSSSKRVPSNSSTSSSTKLQSREEKLAELRQKKLQHLHKAREQQQQQKKKKQLLKTRSNLAAQAALNDDNPISTPPSSSANSHLRAAKKLSNRKLIQNALEYTLLAGFSMEKERNTALMALAQSQCENFVVLLKSTKDLKFRALYEHHTDRQEVVKLFASTPGVPPQLTCDVIGQFFKYNSGKKEFVAIDSRSFTMITDACALRDELVFKKKTALGKLL